MYSRSKIREEIASLKRQYQMDKVSKDKRLSKESEKNAKKDDIKGANENQYIKDFIQTKEKYSAKAKTTLKGQGRFVRQVLNRECYRN